MLRAPKTAVNHQNCATKTEGAGSVRAVVAGLALSCRRLVHDYANGTEVGVVIYA